MQPPPPPPLKPVYSAVKARQRYLRLRECPTGVSNGGITVVLLGGDLGTTAGYDLIRAVLNPIQKGKRGQLTHHVVG